MALLEIEGLDVDFPTHEGVLHAVDDVTLSLDEGEVLGIVGESGSGKSVAVLALMGLVAYPGRVRARRLEFAGQSLLQLSERDRRRIIGRDIAMIFQDPANSLNPCFSIGFQLTETLRIHLGMQRRAARDRAVELLEQVGIAAAASRLSDFPHQLSGGMNQRVMIAMAIACNPRLLIADEPTTALDVTVQAQILDLLRGLQQEHRMALMLVTHDMDVVAEMAQRVMVMYAGQVMELRAAGQLFVEPQHPYTAALMAAMPQRHADAAGDARLATIHGLVPGLDDRPRGCLFAPRCHFATRHCEARPETRTWLHGLVRCHYPLGDAQRDANIAHDSIAVKRLA